LVRDVLVRVEDNHTADYSILTLNCIPTTARPSAEPCILTLNYIPPTTRPSADYSILTLIAFRQLPAHLLSPVY